jgi:cell division protein FtsI/penicillin-binding protein 2
MNPAATTMVFRRSRWAVGAVLLLLAGLLGRLWFIQVARGADYERQAARAHRVRDSVPAPRGVIYDRFERPLAVSVYAPDLEVDAASLRDRPGDVVALARAAGIARTRLASLLQEHPRWVKVLAGVRSEDVRRRIQALAPTSATSSASWTATARGARGSRRPSTTSFRAGARRTGPCATRRSGASASPSWRPARRSRGATST